ncbi:26S proteasome non-ATPase regulatory subunit 9 [Aspergillus campestris IBT 28561]|uniref:Probable 26S proteasome regulatory subunit p27 n=1 Tax=Aspergillus campestris (strain IBT 28561) TaxID=1392248 RepID=A0A2I1DA22_ASPC2|nr:26S proteasome non-ATPase regulatory subunit 9 [Aspergillus campestris IBT 28561]PKY06716.1 26S proteasome non-ATPase regulatory subunit 9 [Aspergillus campestris IBT 28561]
MGILMDDNIHAPTVTSGPSTDGGPPRDLAKLTIVELMQEKQRIEDELSALSSVLSSHGVTMNSTLTTFDGFPRDDIDVAQVRSTRVQIIRLRNDHKDVMRFIDSAIQEHFANTRRTQDTSTANGISGSGSDLGGNTTPAGSAGPPFARVNSVVSASPADQAGLKAGDTIRSFGSVNWLNHERLTKVAQTVQQNEGRPLIVSVSRKSDSDPSCISELQLELVPRQNWGGRGLLGCHLVPL